MLVNKIRRYVVSKCCELGPQVLVMRNVGDMDEHGPRSM